jgi:hypothetical protein
MGCSDGWRSWLLWNKYSALFFRGCEVCLYERGQVIQQESDHRPTNNQGATDNAQAELGGVDILILYHAIFCPVPSTVLSGIQPLQ